MIIALALSASLAACQPISDIARELQAARQAGAPLAKALAIFEQPALQALTLSAWREPRYSTKEHQQRAITEFENRTLLQCMEGVDKK